MKYYWKPENDYIGRKTWWTCYVYNMFNNIHIIKLLYIALFFSHKYINKILYTGITLRLASLWFKTLNVYIIVYNRNLLRKLEVKKIVCVHKTRVHLFCFPTHHQPRTTTNADVLFLSFARGWKKWKIIMKSV